MAFDNPGTEAIREVLTRAKTIAVVGLSPDPDRPSFGVAMYWLILIASQGVAIDGISQASPLLDGLGVSVPAANAQALGTGLKEVFPAGGIGSTLFSM